MRWRGWAWWVGAAAASLAAGAALLSRPEASRPPLRAHGRDVAPRDRSVGPRRFEPALSPPGLPFVAATPTNASLPASAFAVPNDSTPASALAIEQAATVAEPMASTSPVVAPVAPTPSATSIPKLVGPQRVSFSSLAAWSKPGLCSTSDEAEATREKLTASFRHFDDAARSQLHIDPRLPEGVEATLLPLLAQAENEVEQRLGLQPTAPSTFVYFDQQLMKAAACINEDVVAFYDGALHLVANRSDLQQSVTHELTHHALFSSGLIGPAWAQEGVAMLVAEETWWRAPARLQALANLPFSSEQMAELIPYKLPADQALLFYVQAALTVQCLLSVRGWSLRQLTETLRNGTGADSVSFDLPELRSGSFVSSCVTRISQL